MSTMVGMKWGWAVLALFSFVAACGPGPASGAGPVPPTPSPAFATPIATSTPPPALRHVFVIVMENKSYDQALSVPYTASLAARYAVATNYYAVTHPSLPNYLALTSGSTWGITDNAYRALPAAGIGDQLTAAGISWRAYMEGLTGDCRTSPPPYALNHNPFASYGGACPPNVVPLTALETDLASSTPRFVWITPDRCHDTHDCSLDVGDRWLQGIVPKILASEAWQKGGLLLITWDENDGTSGNRVATLIIAPDLVGHSTARRSDHYSLLATVEDRLGVPRLGQAATATPIDALFAPR